ncbi:MAG: zinc-finger domain-containing protein [Janthinobacterium lividum]
MPFGSDTPTPELGTTETILVDSRVLACDGGVGPLGHPRVWLRIVGEQTYCPYCSRIYRLSPGAGKHEH